VIADNSLQYDNTNNTIRTTCSPPKLKCYKIVRIDIIIIEHEIVRPTRPLRSRQNSMFIFRVVLAHSVLRQYYSAMKSRGHRIADSGRIVLSVPLSRRGEINDTEHNICFVIILYFVIFLFFVFFTGSRLYLWWSTQ